MRLQAHVVVLFCALKCRLGNEVDRVKREDASRLQEAHLAELGERILGFSMWCTMRARTEPSPSDSFVFLTGSGCPDARCSANSVSGRSTNAWYRD